MKPISKLPVYRLLYGVFTAISLAGNVVFLFLRTPKEEADYRRQQGSYKDELSEIMIFYLSDL